MEIQMRLIAPTYLSHSFTKSMFVCCPMLEVRGNSPELPYTNRASRSGDTRLKEESSNPP